MLLLDHTRLRRVVLCTRKGESKSASGARRLRRTEPLTLFLGGCVVVLLRIKSGPAGSGVPPVPLGRGCVPLPSTLDTKEENVKCRL